MADPSPPVVVPVVNGVVLGTGTFKEQFWDPVAGFGVTFRTMFKKVVTEQYPFEKLPTAPASTAGTSSTAGPTG